MITKVQNRGTLRGALIHTTFVRAIKEGMENMREYLACTVLPLFQSLLCLSLNADLILF